MIELAWLVIGLLVLIAFLLHWIGEKVRGIYCILADLRAEDDNKDE